MNQLHRILLFTLFLALPTSAHSQGDDWLSLSRLSLSVSSGYYINPWKNYNQAVESAVQSIRLNPRFIEPRGYYETVQGIGTLNAEVAYQLSGRLQLVLNGGYGQLDAGMEFYPEPSFLPSDKRSLAFHQQLSYNQQTYGIGAQYKFHLRDELLLTVGTIIEYHHANMEILWRHNRFSTGPLPEGSGEQLRADLSSSTVGAMFTFGAQYRFWGPVSITGQVRYRISTLNEFEGPATFGSAPGFERPFTAELVEAPNYFGVRVKEQPADPTQQVFLPPLTFLSAPDESARMPASVTLSSFGLSGGVVITF